MKHTAEETQLTEVRYDDAQEYIFSARKQIKQKIYEVIVAYARSFLPSILFIDFGS